MLIAAPKALRELQATGGAETFIAAAPGDQNESVGVVSGRQLSPQAVFPARRNFRLASYKALARKLLPALLWPVPRPNGCPVALGLVQGSLRARHRVRRSRADVDVGFPGGVSRGLDGHFTGKGHDIDGNGPRDIQWLPRPEDRLSTASQQQAG